jgi:Ca-activated chloride channel family protein
MQQAAVAELIAVEDAHVVLEAVGIEAVLRGMYAETAVTQRYRNAEDKAIEAAYTFPLPANAVLLGLTLELNGDLLHGEVKPRTVAEDTYEAGIEAGDTAVLLRKLKDGLYHLSIGNILPGELAVIRYRYAELHHWQGDSLRFHLPTTLAPRYGDPLRAGLAPHEVPTHTLTVDRGFTLSLRVEGQLASADVECPTHPIGIRQHGDAREFHLIGGSGLMDRDFVLVLRQTGQQPAEAIAAPDGEQTVVLASFLPVHANPGATGPRIVKLVVDCSGSMAGDAMHQAKTALRTILQQLLPEDRFTIVAFGSRARSAFPTPEPATRRTLQQAQAFIDRLGADMGGTEIGRALKFAYALQLTPEDQADLLLITDGEVWAHDELIEGARRSGHRIFSVGVGSAVSEAFIRRIAEVTGGASELVAPCEDMAERIVRHFRRIHQPRTTLTVDWPAEPLTQSPETIGTLFVGDTLHVFARFAAMPTGELTFRVQYDDGAETTDRVTLTPLESSSPVSASLPRMAAHARLGQIPTDEARTLAVAYQLVTDHTSFVLVKERAADDKATESPELRVVPQMLAAGWGGTGSVPARRGGAADSAMMFAAMMLDSISACKRKEANDSSDEPGAMDYLDIPVFLRSDVGKPVVRALDVPKNVRRKLIAKALGDALPPHIINALERINIFTVADLLSYFPGFLENDHCIPGLDRDDMKKLEALMRSLGWLS